MIFEWTSLFVRLQHPLGHLSILHGLLPILSRWLCICFALFLISLLLHYTISRSLVARKWAYRCVIGLLILHAVTIYGFSKSQQNFTLSPTNLNTPRVPIRLKQNIVFAFFDALFEEKERVMPLSREEERSLFDHQHAISDTSSHFETLKGPYKHVFHVLLESSTHDAWPHHPHFAQRLGLDDIPEEYNQASFVTPHFDKIAKSSFVARNWYSNARYTVKAQYALNCGVYPRAAETAYAEGHTTEDLPCLPHLLKQLDPTFSTAFMQSATSDFDHHQIVLERTGFETLVSAEDIKTNQPDLRPVNYFGYTEEGMNPLLADHMDKMMAEDRRMFVQLITTTNHHRPLCFRSKVNMYSKSEQHGMSQKARSRRNSQSLNLSSTPI